MKLSLAFTDPEDMAADNQLSAEELKLLEAFVDNQRGGGDGNK
jgi:hypothetical protein